MKSQLLDNLSSGKMEFLEHHIPDKNFKFVKLDMLELEKINTRHQRR